MQQRAAARIPLSFIMDQYMLQSQRVGRIKTFKAKKRLQERMGFKTEIIKELFSFIYQSTFDNGLTEQRN